MYCQNFDNTSTIDTIIVSSFTAECGSCNTDSVKEMAFLLPRKLDILQNSLLYRHISVAFVCLCHFSDYICTEINI